MKRFALILACFAMLALNGCALLDNDSTTKVAFKIGLVELIAQKPTVADQAEFAQSVFDFSKKNKSFFDGEKFPLDEIKAEIYKELNYVYLPVNEKLRADFIIQAAENYVLNKADLGVSTFVTVSQVLGWAMEATRLYGAK